MAAAGVVPQPTRSEAFQVWARIGLLSFGGPAGQIALMHRVLVDEKRWVDDDTFLGGLNFCMLLPGPEAMQLATYVGWRLHGVGGGLMAGLLFVLPGAVLMLALALAYATFGSVPIAEALFLGIKAAVLAIVVQALLRIAARALKGPVDLGIAAAAFLALFLGGVPFPIIVLAAALVGWWRGRGCTGTPAPTQQRIAMAGTLRTIITWAAIWVLPLLGVALVFGGDHVLAQLALLYSKLAVVTFGGAYAVLTYLAQEIVETYRWLSPGEMLDALGLAETTPGPLILVTEFVGVLAAYRHGGGPAAWMGLLGGVVTLWATFAPCFLWIFAGAPYIARLNAMPQLKSALAAITAAVVGVILNLTVWFSLHVLFGRVDRVAAGPLSVDVPDLATWRGDAFALAILAALLLFLAKRGIGVTLAVTGAAALAWHGMTAQG